MEALVKHHVGCHKISRSATVLEYILLFHNFIVNFTHLYCFHDTSYHVKFRSFFNYFHVLFVLFYPISELPVQMEWIHYIYLLVATLKLPLSWCKVKKKIPHRLCVSVRNVRSNHSDTTVLNQLHPPIQISI